MKKNIHLANYSNSRSTKKFSKTKFIHNERKDSKL